MGACSNDEPQGGEKPQPSTDKVSFEIANLEYNSVDVTITPKSDDDIYFAYLYPDTEEFMAKIMSEYIGMDVSAM